MAKNTFLLNSDASEVIERALVILNSGGVISIATDTVYGIASKFDNISGIEKLYEIKKRQKSKAIAVLIGDTAQLDLVAKNINHKARLLADEFWPGGLTLIVERNPNLPAILSSTDTIGVRMPDHDHTRNLIIKSGPLATTSANYSGEPELTTGGDVFNKFNGKIDLVLDSGKSPGGVPSTVLDCTQNPPVILREGAIPNQVIASFLGLSG